MDSTENVSNILEAIAEDSADNASNIPEAIAAEPALGTASALSTSDAKQHTPQTKAESRPLNMASVGDNLHLASERAKSAMLMGTMYQHLHRSTHWSPLFATRVF